MLPERVRAWVQDRLTDRVEDVTRVPGGITDTIWRVGLIGADPVILRWVEPERFGDEGRHHVVREALGCAITAVSAIPSPRLIASDPDGARTGGWANLTTFRPGRVRLGDLGPAAVDALAAVAVEVHATGVPGDVSLPCFIFWGESDPSVPRWAARPGLWEAAFALAAGSRPDTAPGLLHRDFHPGNTLWRGDEVTGLIDWAETCWGPADLDVAHACSNFAMLHSVDAATAFRRAYVRQGGRLDPDPDARRYWAVRDIMGFLPDPAPVVVALTRQRPDLHLDAVRTRLEQLLAATMAGEVV